MGLYEVSGSGLVKQKPTQFAGLKMKERADLQRLLRNDVSVLGEDLMVISEEFGNWEDARRRIDLLAIDKAARLVVIELKRTDDGGHMELQAIRYAAMVSTMSFADVLSAFRSHRAKHPRPDGDSDAEEELHAFLEVADSEEEPEISSDVRIVLVSADFGVEITTSVIWLNKFEGMDIRCVRLRPYNVDGKVLLDIQQVLPLPEAADYQVKVRRKEAAIERARTDGRDFTRYSIVIDGEAGDDLNKRRAVLAMIRALVDRGVKPSAIKTLLPAARMLTVDQEIHDVVQIEEACRKASSKFDPGRWFLSDAMIEDGQTYIVTKMWGRNTEPILTKLANAFPDAGISFKRHAE